MPQLWETRDLLTVTYADESAPNDNFWLAYFPTVFTSTAEEILFNQLPLRDRRLAAFVPPNVAGRVYSRRGVELSSFRPAYVKPKHIIDPSKPFVRDAAAIQAAFVNGGAQPDPQLLFNQAIAANLIHERELIERRWEWLACRAICDGFVDIAGEDYPKVHIDFRRDASLTRTLAPGATWAKGDTGNPLADIKDLRAKGFALGRAPMRTAIFGLDAWDAFAANDEVRALLDNTKRISDSNVNVSGIADGTPVEDMGIISGANGQGRLQCYTYSNTYEDDTGALVPFMDPRDVVLVGTAVNGVRAFGAIKDLHGLQATPIFPRNYLEDRDPANYYTLSQSAPLMVPANANNTARIRAVA